MKKLGVTKSLPLKETVRMTSDKDRSGENLRKAEVEEAIQVPRGGRLRRRWGRGRRSEEEDEEVVKWGKGRKRAKKISHSAFSVEEFFVLTATVPAIFEFSPFFFFSKKMDRAEKLTTLCNLWENSLRISYGCTWGQIDSERWRITDTIYKVTC